MSILTCQSVKAKRAGSGNGLDLNAGQSPAETGI